METTTYGYQLPDQGDKAKGVLGWFKALAFNITRFDAHNHDGTNSPLLTISNYTPFENAILAASWVTDGAGGYSQVVTVPAGLADLNDYNTKFVFTAPAGKVGQAAYLGYKRLTATTYQVFCNDNTAAFLALYR